MDGKDAAADEKIKELNGFSYSPALSNNSEHRNTSILIPAVSGIKHDLSQDKHQLLKEDDGLSKRAVLTAIQAPDPKRKQHLANLEKLRRAAKKRANIAKLVTRLEGAILRMDAPEVKRLIRRLSAAKGEDNLYVLNLKAFWYLKQKRYVEAETLLKKILKLDQDHLEAGLNMAIVEVKTQRSDAALKRLKRLKALYPENPVLVEMIQKLS
jgi:predicted Zn-dependent protease